MISGLPGVAWAFADKQAWMLMAVFRVFMGSLQENAVFDPGFDYVFGLFFGEVGAEQLNHYPGCSVCGVCGGAISAPLVGAGLDPVDDLVDHGCVEFCERIGR